MAAGGSAVAHDAEGRVVFVEGAIPGERVSAQISEEKKSFSRAAVTEVLHTSPHRRTPPCRYVAEGCGGCDWQHITPSHQLALRQQVVEGALGRLGGASKPVVEPGPELPSEAYRTTVRCLVVDGRAAYRRRGSHEGVVIDDCLIAHPLISELIAEGRFADAREVTLRVGARTGERLVIAHPTAHGVSVPDGVRVVGTDDLKRGRRAWYHEDVAGRSWRISATSFFQDRPDGAEALIDRAAQLIARHAPDAGHLVDLCSGVGLFAGTLGQGRRVTAVERHRSALADARVNLAADDVKLVGSSFERWRPTKGDSAADVVLADPARSGLGRKGVAVVAATGAPLVLLVSCDPASLGRDAGLLGDVGYRSLGSSLVDLFPQTSHVETMTGFIR